METKELQDNRICRAKLFVSDDETYDFEAVAVPFENGQLRYSYEHDEYFMQVLSVERGAIESERLEHGLPLFDNHTYDQSAANTLGVTTSYTFDDRGLVVRCKFGARADEALRSDIKNGIINSVSIEGRINRYEVDRTLGQVPVYKAVSWTPESLSFAPVPNDIGAKIEVKRALETQLNKKKVSALDTLINKF